MRWVGVTIVALVLVSQTCANRERQKDIRPPLFMDKPAAPQVLDFPLDRKGAEKKCMAVEVLQEFWSATAGGIYAIKEGIKAGIGIVVESVINAAQK
jgi:hypothetical protein